MKHEIHERILLYLYELRENDEKFDLLIKFIDINETLLRENIEHLDKEKLIEVEYPFLGFGTVNLRTGETNFPYKDTNKFIKAKIKPAGTEYVKQNLLKKSDTLDKWSKIIGISGIIFGAIIGTITLVRENKYQEQRQLNIDLQQNIDSIKQLQRAKETVHDSLLKTRDKKIEILILTIDSLTLKLNDKKQGSKVAPMQRPR
jgi:hypothetical protein